MEEPPAKRARRTDSSAMWERNDTSATSSPRPHDDDRDLRHKGSERDDKRRDGDHRRRSTSRDRNDRKRDRSRSPVRSDRDRDRDKNRDRDRVKDTGRDRDREGRSRRDHDRSRSRDRHRGSKEHAPSRSDHARRRSRSRSPARNGANTSTRARSPPRGPRTDRDRPPQRDKAKDEDKRALSSKPTKSDPEAMQIDKKATANGHKDAVSDEDDEDALLKKMMGFSSFKSTQNTKVPGNNVYGVRKEKKTEYRQYMNRVGGFNRPLSPTR